jgi:hypothetical protein
MNDLDRFYSHVYVDETTGCHIWKDAKNPKGYGQFSVRRSKAERDRRPRGGNKRVSAHKWIFEYYNGPVPTGHEVDHKCCNTACVNYEEHLQAITKAKNLELRGQVHLG